MKKWKYEAPVARDLSGAAASGQVPPTRPSCSSGQTVAQPQGWCVSGTSPSQPGGDCNFGLQPTSPRTCAAGFLAINACNTGSAPAT
jgi:hypothetical protein